MRVTSLSPPTSSSLYCFNKIFTTPSSLHLKSIPFVFESKLKSHTLSLKTKTKNPHYYTCFSILPSSTVQLTQDENRKTEYEGDAQIESHSGEDSRLYVGNLPYAMTSSQLSDVFAQAGNVVTVQIVYDRVTDRSRGFGFVTMSSVEEAKEAIRMFDGCQVGGRTVRVNFPEVPKGGEMMGSLPNLIRRRSSRDQVGERGFVDTPHKLYAGNLSWSLTSKALREALEDQPGFLSAKVIYDRDTGTSRGFGFITFQSAEEAQSALKSVDGVELEGRPLRLKLAGKRD